MLRPGTRVIVAGAERREWDELKARLVERETLSVPNGQWLWCGSVPGVVDAVRGGANLPTIVSYYTAGTQYEQHAQRLIESLQGLNLPHLVVPVDSLGCWERNCSYKPSFVLEMWRRLKTPILWVDADATAHALPLRLARRHGSSLFFLQVGAMDGKNFDPLFEHVRRYQWQGLLIEPLPDMFERLRRNYADCAGLLFENSAVADTVGEIEIHRVPLHLIDSGVVPSWAAGISSLYPDRNAIGGKRTPAEDFAKIRDHIEKLGVRGEPLPSILARHRIERIDLLQIDTEGHDYKVLRQFDFNRYRPELVQMEIYNLPEEEPSRCAKTAGGCRIQGAIRPQGCLGQPIVGLARDARSPMNTSMRGSVVLMPRLFWRRGRPGGPSVVASTR